MFKNYLNINECFSNTFSLDAPIKIECEVDIEDFGNDDEPTVNNNLDQSGDNNNDQSGDDVTNATIKYATGRCLNYNDPKIPFGNYFIFVMFVLLNNII